MFGVFIPFPDSIYSIYSIYSVSSENRTPFVITQVVADSGRYFSSMTMSKNLDRRGFLAVIGVSAGAAVTVASASGAIAATTRPAVTRSRTVNLFRKGVFPRGSQWSIPGGELVVTRKRGIRSTDGQLRLNRDSFEVIFKLTSGKHPGHGTTTLTNSQGQDISMHLVQIRPNRYSAIINSQPSTEAGA